MMQPNNIPLIVSIDGNSHVDGPGIRSVIFFKGCPLDCIWCQNPESKNISSELWWEKEKCIDCEECIKVCPEGAISKNNPFYINRNICTFCFKCVEVCPSKAMSKVGNKMSVDEMVKQVIRYKPFFDRSGGGVTLSGGEPTLSMKFVSSLLKRFKDEGIHTLLETAGIFNLERFESLILKYVDIIYFDIKFIDPIMHKRYCGVTNELIINNFIQLHNKSQSNNFDLVPRTPLIPGITDSDVNIHQIMKFYKEHQIQKAVFLPNNPAWMQKLEKSGKSITFDTDDPIYKFYDIKKEEKLKNYFSENGIEIVFG
ncbi:MAG: glycyl-radical enzyme activating protein [Bacteroidota bacterium]